jgi:hypothetical protein
MVKLLSKAKTYEALFWSLGLPGFGQLLNKKLAKGLLLIALEILINVQSNLNEIILLSFQGNIISSIQKTNYGWLMFYPCVYMFGIWDAYRDANEELEPFAYIPFVSAAYFATVGLMYSSRYIFGYLLGPVWLTSMFCFLGIGVGVIVRNIMIKSKPS